MARILLVEDDKHIGGYVAREIQSRGNEVLHKTSGENIAEEAAAFRPSLAILDVMLPGISGFEICRILRAHPALYTTSILVLTAMGDAEERDHALRQGADDFLSKPFKMVELAEKIANLLELHSRTVYRREDSPLLTPQGFNKLVAHHLACRTERSLCCVSIESLQTYRIKRGADAHARVVGAVAGMVERAIEEEGTVEVCVSHLGGGFFGVLLPHEKVTPVCEAVSEAFRRKLATWHTPEELKRGRMILHDPRRGTSEAPLMGLSTRVVRTDSHGWESQVDVFSELDQLVRGVALPPSGGVFVDRRASGTTAHASASRGTSHAGS
jgi:DNA-binding response OmpR family regulator